MYHSIDMIHLDDCYSVSFEDFGGDSLLVNDVRGYHGILSELASNIRDRILLQRTVCNSWRIV